VVDDPAGLVAAAGGAEVAQQPGPQALGLADIDQGAARVDHAVDARAARALAAEFGPQRVRPAGGDEVQGSGGGVELRRAEAREPPVLKQAAHRGVLPIAGTSGVAA
jgi:hypothetical protein